MWLGGRLARVIHLLLITLAYGQLRVTRVIDNRVLNEHQMLTEPSLGSVVRVIARVI